MICMMLKCNVKDLVDLWLFWQLYGSGSGSSGDDKDPGEPFIPPITPPVCTKEKSIGKKSKNLT